MNQDGIPDVTIVFRYSASPFQWYARLLLGRFSSSTPTPTFSDPGLAPLTPLPSGSLSVGQSLLRVQTMRSPAVRVGVCLVDRSGKSTITQIVLLHAEASPDGSTSLVPVDLASLPGYAVCSSASEFTGHMAIISATTGGILIYSPDPLVEDGLVVAQLSIPDGMVAEFSNVGTHFFDLAHDGRESLLVSISDSTNHLLLYPFLASEPVILADVQASAASAGDPWDPHPELHSRIAVTSCFWRGTSPHADIMFAVNTDVYTVRNTNGTVAGLAPPQRLGALNGGVELALECADVEGQGMMSLVAPSDQGVHAFSSATGNATLPQPWSGMFCFNFVDLDSDGDMDSLSSFGSILLWSENTPASSATLLSAELAAELNSRQLHEVNQVPPSPVSDYILVSDGRLEPVSVFASPHRMYYVFNDSSVLQASASPRVDDYEPEIRTLTLTSACAPGVVPKIDTDGVVGILADFDQQGVPGVLCAAPSGVFWNAAAESEQEHLEEYREPLRLADAVPIDANVSDSNWPFKCTSFQSDDATWSSRTDDGLVTVVLCVSRRDVRAYWRRAPGGDIQQAALVRLTSSEQNMELFTLVVDDLDDDGSLDLLVGWGVRTNGIDRNTYDLFGVSGICTLERTVSAPVELSSISSPLLYVDSVQLRSSKMQLVVADFRGVGTKSVGVFTPLYTTMIEPAPLDHDRPGSSLRSAYTHCPETWQESNQATLSPAIRIGGPIAISDFRGAGMPDILTTGFPALTLSLGDGEGFVGPSELVPRTPASFDGVTPILATADLDFDSRPDLGALRSHFITRPNSHGVPVPDRLASFAAVYLNRIPFASPAVVRVDPENGNDGRCIFDSGRTPCASLLATFSHVLQSPRLSGNSVVVHIASGTIRASAPIFITGFTRRRMFIHVAAGGITIDCSALRASDFDDVPQDVDDGTVRQSCVTIAHAGLGLRILGGPITIRNADAHPDDNVHGITALLLRDSANVRIGHRHTGLGCAERVCVSTPGVWHMLPRRSPVQRYGEGYSALSVTNSSSGVSIVGSSNVFVGSLQVSQVHSGSPVSVKRCEQVVLSHAVLRDNSAVTRHAFSFANHDQASGGLHCRDSDVYLLHSLITNNRMQSDAGCGAGLLLDTCRVTLHGVNVTHNESPGDGGGACISHSLQVVLVGTRFIGNRARDGSGGGIFSLNSQLSVSVLPDQLEPATKSFLFLAHNHASQSGGGIYFSGQQTFLHELVTGYTEVAHNQAAASGGGALFDSSANAVLSRWNLRHNAAGEGGALSILGSKVSLDSCQASYNTAVLGGAIALHGSAQVQMSVCRLDALSTKIMRNHAAMWGGGIASYGCDVRLDLVDLSHNSAGVGGGGMYVSDESTVRVVRDSAIEANRVVSGSGGGFYFKRLEEAISTHFDDQVRVPDNHAVNGGGGFAFFETAPNSVATANEPRVFASIYNMSRLEGTDSCRALYGNIMGTSPVMLYIQRSQATAHEQSSRSRFRGDVVVDVRDVFGQVASNRDDLVVFVSHEVLEQGVVHGKRMHKAAPMTTLTGASSLQALSGVSNWTGELGIEAMPGSTVGFRFHSSIESKTVSSDMMEVRIQECKPGTFVEDMLRCKECPLGRVSNASNVADCSPCDMGTFQDARGGRECQPCERGFFVARVPTGASQCTACPQGSFAAEQGQQKCEQCPMHHIAAATGAHNCTRCPGSRYANQRGSASCEACPSNKFTVFHESAGGRAECHECLANTHCDGSTRVRANTGYWVQQHMSSGEVDVYRCKPGLCESGDCGDGRKPSGDNPLCGECLPNYAQWSGECVDCSEGTRWGVVAALVLVSLVVTAVLHMISCRGFESTPELDILLYFVQTSLLIISSSGTEGFFSLQVFNFEFLNTSGSVCVAYLKPEQLLLLQLLAPLSVFVWWLLGAAFHSARGKQMTPFWRSLIALFVASYNGVITNSLKLFKCVDVATPDGGSVSLLESMPSVHCDSDGYRVLLFAGAALLVLFVIVVPVFLSMRLVRAHRQYLLRSDSFLSVFGLLSGPYRSSFFFWTMGTIAQRAALAGTIVMFDNRQHELAITSLLNTAFLVAHVLAHPYRSMQNNLVQGLSLSMLTLLTMFLPLMSFPYRGDDRIVLLTIWAVPSLALVTWAAHTKGKVWLNRWRAFVPFVHDTTSELASGAGGGTLSDGSWDAVRKPSRSSEPSSLQEMGQMSTPLLESSVLEQES